MRKVQNRKNSFVLIDSLRKKQKYKVYSNEKKTFIIFLTEGKDQRGKVEVIISGEKAEVQILGIILGFGRQKIRLCSLQNHLKADSKSELLIRSVLFQKSQFHYQGLIRIEKQAQKSDASLRAKNLLMSRKASVVSKPYLEILANNVRCAHAATISKIDEEQLYYLVTRGLDKLGATELLLMGFFQEIMEKIPNKEVRKEINKKLSSKISSLIKKKNN